MENTKTYRDRTYWKYKDKEKTNYKDKSINEINENIKEILIDNEIDPREQEYIQFENKRNMEKIDEIYYNALDKLNDAHEEMIEKIMKKHRQLEQEKDELSK